MNILFLSLGVFNDLSEGSVHIDLLKRFAEEHNVWLACKNEGKNTELTEEYGINILRIRTGSLKNTGLIKKGINTIMVESQFKKAIKRYTGSVRFDLILYTTPPITFASAIKLIKNRDGARTYLMLKDIFPQNAVDLGMMTTSGIRGFVYRYFRNKEKKLYSISDFIGCMSPENINYLLDHNPEISSDIVEVCPNSTVIEDMSVDERTKKDIRIRYGIPLGKKVFVYGGNLGKPQGIPFLIDCLKACSHLQNVFVLIIGQGTEFGMLQKAIQSEKIRNCMLLKRIPKRDFEVLVAACDVGMIFLDHRFTIPNFPSRLISYMKAKLPVLAATDSNTDVGEIIVEGGFGWWCESNDADHCANLIERIACEDIVKAGEKGYEYMIENYDVNKAYDIIFDHFR